MDTPESKKIGAPISKVEDSPVFNYINSLSPIKPVKSLGITQSFSSINFPSPPSIFTSPHVSFLKESRFLRRHNVSDPSRPKISTEDENKICGKELVVADSDLGDHNELGDASAEPPNDQSLFPSELTCMLKYDCTSPDNDQAHSCDNVTDSVLALSDKMASVTANEESLCVEDSSWDEVNFPRLGQIEQTLEGIGCDWESLISDATDLLIFNSPNQSEAFRGLMQKSLSPSPLLGTFILQSPQNNIGNAQKIHNVHSNDSDSQHKTDNIQCNSKHMEGKQAFVNVANISSMSTNPTQKMDNEPFSIMHRGMLRRCLDFEMAGALRKTSDDGPPNSSSCMSESNNRFAANANHSLPRKRTGNSQRHVLPGIGLHLNALATTCKDYTNVKHEPLSSEKQSSFPSDTSPLISPRTSQENPLPSSTSVSTERDLDIPENGIQHGEDGSLASAYLASEDLSPKKKRSKIEAAGEGDSCKRCNCKKSKCLKLYCECFAAGVYCIEPCSCQDCFNKPIHEDTVLATRKQIESRNPLAFAPKVIRSSDSVTEAGDESNKTPASARHKRGCNCKKSNCLKKYCECYQGGVGCSPSCRCEGCKNTFGTKDASLPLGVEVEHEEETESEKGIFEKVLEETEIQNNEENPESSVPATPLRFCRSLVPLPFSSRSKSQQSVLSTISSSRLYTSQKLGKPSILRSESKYKKRFDSAEDNKIPEILQGDCSPSTCIKSSSPNSKRITSPCCDFGPSSSPSRRSGRKLILQSIPSFPSLTPHH